MDDTDVLDRVVATLRDVPGVAALALGGSRARGTHLPSSDFDVGIYYRSDVPFDLAALADAARALDDEHRRDLVTAPGGWGPWVDGGGWLTVGGLAVDLLYRDLRRVRAVAEDCAAGRVEIAYQPGHPHGFVSSTYLGEVACAVVLHDPLGALAALRRVALPYPPALATALRDKFLWEAGFSLAVAAKGAERGDVAHAMACATRSVFCLLQVLFARNGRYLLNEKGALALADGFALAPRDLRRRTEAALALLAPDAAGIRAALSMLQELITETEAGPAASSDAS